MPATHSAEIAPARLVLLWGVEEDEKRRVLEELIDARVAPENRQLDVEYLDATSPGFTAEAAVQAARDRAMFSERRVVVVQNAQRFRDRRTYGLQQSLAEALPHLPDYATVIFLARHVEGRDPRSGAPVSPALKAAVRKWGKEINCGPAKPADLVQRAHAEARALGKRLARGAVEELLARVNTGVTGLIQEVRKLSAYAGDRAEITAEDVRELVTARPEDNVFRLLDEAANGQRAQAMHRLRQLLAAGEPAQRILFWMRRSLRELAQAKFVKEQRIPHHAGADRLPAEVTAALPAEGNLYANPRQAWKRQYLWTQVDRFTWEQLRATFDRLCLAEAALKGWETGIDDPDTALEVLVLRLCGSRPAAGR